MPPLNLDPIKRFFEVQMLDTVRITHDEEGSSDDKLNQLTGLYSVDEDDPTLVYEGKGLITPLSVFPSQVEQGGASIAQADYEVHIPIESNPVSVDDKIEVLECIRNPHLVGTVFTVRAVSDSSVSVSQTMRVFRQVQRLTR